MVNRSDPAGRLESPALQFISRYFLLASAVAFFGWLFETMSFVILWEPQDRGLLTLPFCYLYGSIVVVIWFVLGTPFAGNMGKLYQKCRGETPSLVRRIGAAALSVAVYFVAVTVLSTLLELIVGLIFMKGLGIPLWSYKNFDHTFMDIICLDFSLLWGVLITVGMCTLWPFLQFLERKLSPKARAVAAIVLAVLVVCDFAFNVTYFAVTGLHFDLY